MNSSLLTRLDHIVQKLEAVTLFLSSPNATDDMEAFRRNAKEHAEFSEIVACFKAWKQAIADQRSAEQMRSDPELREFAQEEYVAATDWAAAEEERLRILLLPKDPNDERNLFLEIRAGTGGDESTLFSADLLRMYLRFAERNNWESELISASASEMGGYKEVIVRIIGVGAYSRLKFESGVHRVQRVPDTEAQGRIHTSACTVAVMPEVDPVQVGPINSEDLRIDLFRASGAGGQHVNRTESAVRLTHIPTGLVVECQDDRSQHRNKEKAMQVLAARLQDRQERLAHSEEAAHRRSLIGTGDRSERIRTYNYPQGRITDHRINLTLYKLSSILDGDLSELIGSLSSEHQARLLAELGEDLD